MVVPSSASLVRLNFTIYAVGRLGSDEVYGCKTVMNQTGPGIQLVSPIE